MNIDNDIFKLLVFLPFGILLLYSLVVVIGNHWILRAGGQTAHENYPKVVEGMRAVFVAVFVSSLLFFLVILNYVPSEVVVTLVSISVGVFGTLVLQKKQ